MAGDAQATRKRLLDAATAEFAAYGIAGARVDRIADAAGSNKAQIYHYFGSKDALFDAVMAMWVAGTLDEVPIDATDLPAYAGKLFDRYQKHPELQRLATWYRLERTARQDPLAPLSTSYRDKVAAVAAAQKSGVIPARYSAVDLLALVLNVSSMWSILIPEYEAIVSRTSVAHRRKIVVDAVRVLVEA
jgi:AcrR family transcriptional regulator